MKGKGTCRKHNIHRKQQPAAQNQN